MARYINADKAMEIITEVIHDTVSENADVVASEVEYAFDSMPTADVQDFFTEDEKALINEYKDAVNAVDFKVAILNAISVALDKTYWLNVFRGGE